MSLDTEGIDMEMLKASREMGSGKGIFPCPADKGARGSVVYSPSGDRGRAPTEIKLSEIQMPMVACISTNFNRN